MFTDKNHVSAILKRPNAALIVKEIQQVLEEEKKKRQMFYNEIHKSDRVEFVNGEVLYRPPSDKAHQDTAGNLLGLLDTFVAKNGLGWVGFDRVLTCFSRNAYMPDLCFFKNNKASKFTEAQMYFPIPDVMIEVLSKSSKKTIEHDTKTKYQGYELHGVLEYWIVDPHETTVKQYVLTNGKYELIAPTKDGIIRCGTVKGFNIPIASIFDSRENRKTLRAVLNGNLSE